MGKLTPTVPITTQTATFTTDPATFAAEHTFDLGQSLTCVKVTETVLALTPDGETFGTNTGNVQALSDTLETSLDNVTFYPDAATVLVGVDGPEVGQFMIRLALAARYLKVRHSIGQDWNPYAGPNHPTATVRIDVEYL